MSVVAFCGSFCPANGEAICAAAGARARQAAAAARAASQVRARIGARLRPAPLVQGAAWQCTRRGEGCQPHLGEAARNLVRGGRLHTACAGGLSWQNLCAIAQWRCSACRDRLVLDAPPRWRRRPAVRAGACWPGLCCCSRGLAPCVMAAILLTARLPQQASQRCRSCRTARAARDEHGNGLTTCQRQAWQASKAVLSYSYCVVLVCGPNVEKE